MAIGASSWRCVGAGLDRRISIWRALGGAGIGLCVAAGWYFTYNLSAQLFDPIPVESLSFVRPVATTGALLVDWSLVPAWIRACLRASFSARLLAR
jgi:uncharacterized protein